MASAGWHARTTPQPGVTRHPAIPTVLIVDDEPDFRESLASVMRVKGYIVEEAANGTEALDKLRWGLQPQVILLDLQMRVMTGWDFRVEQLRDPQLATIPVIAMTAGPWKDRDAAGFNQRVQKPLDLERLWSVLDPYR
jgi:CheY-like chemotaxis protein